MTTIEIPGYITRAKTLTDMTLILADLLEKAEDSALPAPNSAQLYHGSQDVLLGFPGRQASFHILAQWAERFGGTVTGDPYTHEDGRESIYTRARFDYMGVTVDASAFITAEETPSTT
jgi:hypothetical protein